jgi:hypothetical protein
LELVNGYWCRNCADVELARQRIDPARPHRELSGGEVYVPPPPPKPWEDLGVNRPEASGTVGTRLNLKA